MKTTPFLFALLFAASLSAQPPVIVNSNVTSTHASGDLRAQLESTSGWSGYRVPSIAGHRVSCCDGGGCGTCRLEGGNYSNFHGDPADGPVREATDVVLFVKSVDHRIDAIRLFSADCRIDARGEAITWIDGVDPRASVAMLSSLIDAGHDRVNSYISALALHADRSATDRLLALAGPTRPDEVRTKAAFWLTTTRGAEGYEAVHRIVRDPSSSAHLREKLIFALMQSDEPHRIDDVIDLAHNDPDHKVRGQALFWLAQKAGRKIADTLRDATNDPDEYVKEKAVFAISQLPDDESIPLLADVIEHNKNPEVRKKAVFWLGQKKDPRALAEIEKILRE